MPSTLNDPPTGPPADPLTGAGADAARRTPTDQLLTGSLIVAPLMYLAADSTYAALGWKAAPAGVLHVLAAIAYGFVVFRVAAWLAPNSVLAAGILLTGVVGLAGNVAYGFDTIHMSLGDIQLVDQPGAANLIKPLGLFFPLSFALIAFALMRLGHRWQGILVLVAIIGWPVAHIGNIAALAVLANIGLVVGFGSLLWTPADNARLGRNRSARLVRQSPMWRLIRSGRG